MVSHKEVAYMATAKTLTESKMREDAQAMIKAWNDHAVEGILALLSDDVLWTEPGLIEPARGKDAVGAHLRDTFKAFPNLHLPIEDVRIFSNEEEQTNVVTWTFTATMNAPLEIGLPATGKSVRTTGATVSRFRDGKVSEYRTYFDSLDFLQQLSLLPKTDSLGFKALVMAEVLAGKAGELAGKAVKAARR